MPCQMTMTLGDLLAVLAFFISNVAIAVVVGEVIYQFWWRRF